MSRPMWIALLGLVALGAGAGLAVHLATRLPDPLPVSAARPVETQAPPAPPPGAPAPVPGTGGQAPLAPGFPNLPGSVAAPARAPLPRGPTAPADLQGGPVVPLPEGAEEGVDALAQVPGQKPGDAAAAPDRRAAGQPPRPVRGPARNPTVAGQPGSPPARRVPPGAPPGRPLPEASPAR